MRGEPAIVVEDRKELTYLLCQAAELEHAVMCEYLYAAFSLKSTAGRGVRDDQLEVVERWRRVLLDIAREEMLHWAVVQNLLTAVGSAPYVSRPHMPHQAKGYPPGVQFRLLPFGEAALQHFVYFERPEGVDRADAEGFDLAGPPLLPMRPEEIVPRGQDFATQGHLYRSVESGFAHLADKLGEGRLFIGPAFQQADETAFGWPDLGPITDLEGANRAVERIVEQGEGATGDWATAHYGRFLDMLDDYLAMRKEDPGFEPAHPVLAAGMRGVEGIEPDVYITDPITGGCSDLFNAVYELLLQMIARYFAFGRETPHSAKSWPTPPSASCFERSSHLASCSLACQSEPITLTPQREPTSSSPTAPASCYPTTAQPGFATPNASTSWPPSQPTSIPLQQNTPLPQYQTRLAAQPPTS